MPEAHKNVRSATVPILGQARSPALHWGIAKQARALFMVKNSRVSLRGAKRRGNLLDVRESWEMAVPGLKNRVELFANGSIYSPSAVPIRVDAKDWQWHTLSFREKKSPR